MPKWSRTWWACLIWGRHKTKTKQKQCKTAKLPWHHNLQGWGYRWNGKLNGYDHGYGPEVVLCLQIQKRHAVSDSPTRAAKRTIQARKLQIWMFFPSGCNSRLGWLERRSSWRTTSSLWTRISHPAACGGLPWTGDTLSYTKLAMANTKYQIPKPLVEACHGQVSNFHPLSFGSWVPRPTSHYLGQSTKMLPTF